MAPLSDDTLVLLLASYGLAGESLVTGVEIVFAESGGDPAAQGRNGPTPGCPNGSVDRGLWQFNSCYHNEVSDTCAYDPECSTQAAAKYAPAFAPWAGDIAARDRGRALAAIKKAGIDITGGLVKGLTDGGGCAAPKGVQLLNPVAVPAYLACLVQEAFTLLFSPETWIRVGETVGGFILILAGVAFLFRDQIKGAVQSAGTVAAVAA